MKLQFDFMNVGRCYYCWGYFESVGLGTYVHYSEGEPKKEKVCTHCIERCLKAHTEDGKCKYCGDMVEYGLFIEHACYRDRHGEVTSFSQETKEIGG